MAGPSSVGKHTLVEQGEREPFIATSADRDGAIGPLVRGTTAQEWMWTWGTPLTARLGSYLEATAFALPTPFAVWKTGSSSAFARAMWAPIVALDGKGQPYATLARLLTPDPLDPHINAGRDAVVVETPDAFGVGIQPRGDRGWAEPVVAEVGKIVSKRIIESLARVMPRWLAARNQLDRDPRPGEVVPSHPIDRHVAAGLERQLSVSLTAYRQSHPEAPLAAPREVAYQWQHDQGAWNWLRVTQPAHPTAEDVAWTLYGDASFAHTITDAAPLFGISNLDELVEPARAIYARQAAAARRPAAAGDDPELAAPAQQVQTSTPLAVEVMLAQAPGSASDRAAILDRMTAGLQLFQLIQQQARAMPHGGYDALLASASARLQQRALRAADPSTSIARVAPWEGQTRAQHELLADALHGIAMAVQQHAVFSAWPSSAHATQQLGWMYLEVACLSEQARAGQAALAAANQQSQLFPVTVMDLVLAEVRKLLHTEAGAKLDAPRDGDAGHDARTDLAEHQRREARLRLGLARVRDKLLQHQQADDELRQLQRELTELQHEVAIVGDLDAMERAWQALYDDVSAVGALSRSNAADADAIDGVPGHDRVANPSLRELHTDWQRIYGRYRGGDRAGALAELATKRPRWARLHAEIGTLIRHNETKNKWVLFGLMIGVSLATAGVGAYIEGVGAAAWGASSWATFAVTTGAEATSFTAMSYTIVENDPTIGGWFVELGKNLVMFGALKGVASAYVRAVGKQAAGTADTMVVQFASMNTASLVEADVRKYAATRRHLTFDEVLEISKQTALFTIASAASSALARPGLETLKLTGAADAALRPVRTLRRALAAQLAHAGAAAPRRAGELLDQQRALLAAEGDALRTLEQLAADPARAQQAGLDDAAKQQLDADRQAHDETARVVELATAMAHTEGSGPVRYVARGGKLDEVVQFWRRQGARVRPVPVDPQLGTRAFEIATKTGETFRLLERSGGGLDNAKVAASMNAQLDRIDASQVDAILARFPADQQARAREVLGRASGFGHMDALDALRAALEPHLRAGKKLFLPGRGSLADNLSYLSGKTGGDHSAFASSNLLISVTRVVDANTVVILDDVMLARIRSDRAVASGLVDQRVVLLEPRGFTSGLNMFNAATPEAIQAKLAELLQRASALQATQGGAFDDAISAVLDASTHATLTGVDAKLAGQLQVVDPAAHPELASARLADQLNGKAGIDERAVGAALSRLSPADQALLRELLFHQAEIFSPRRQAKHVASQAARILELARQTGVAPGDVYYFVYLPEKSYGMVAMAHHEATGTPVDHYLDGELALKARKLGSNTMLVILDDVAGSGVSLQQATTAVRATGYPGEVVVSPLVSTEQANVRFNGVAGDHIRPGLVNQQSKLTYAPEQMVQSLKDSDWFKSLSEAQRAQLEEAVNHYGTFQNGLSMAFPYMAPDNNNAFFADMIAKYFIMNGNAAAAKNAYGAWAPPKEAK